MDKKKTLAQWIKQSREIVFFGGAGVSTESGIPDFRSAGGLYHAQYPKSPETILSRSFFDDHTDLFFQFYREKMIHPEAQPNAAHKALAAWEQAGKSIQVVTQNIDGLHQAAGSKRVLELHGSIHRNRCMHCGNQASLQAILAKEGIPRCACGGILKPEVVLYEEPLDPIVMAAAKRAVQAADLLIVGGTSLSVYPAAGLVQHYHGEKLVLINRSPTPYDHHAGLHFTESIGALFSALAVG